MKEQFYHFNTVRQQFCSKTGFTDNLSDAEISDGPSSTTVLSSMANALVAIEVTQAKALCQGKVVGPEQLAKSFLDELGIEGSPIGKLLHRSSSFTEFKMGLHELAQRAPGV